MRAIAPIGEALLKAQIERDVSGLSRLGDTLDEIDRKLQVGPKSSDKARKLAGALREAASVADLPALHLAWRRLVACVGNQSRLILDNSLDSFYLQDVAVSKMSETLSRMAWAVHMVQRSHDPSAQGADLAGALVGLNLSSESAASSLASAYAAARDGRLKAALAQPYAQFSNALGVFQSDMQRNQASLEDARAVLDGTHVFSATVSQELERLIGERIGELRRTQILSVAIASLLFLTTMVFIVLVVVGGVTRPLARLTRAMQRLADGDLEVEVPCQHHRDELGCMARTMETFIENARAAQNLRTANERNSRLQAERREGLEAALLSDLNGTVQARLTWLASAATELEATSAALSVQADQTRQLALGLTGDASIASQNAQSVASAAEELAASNSEINRQVESATQTTEEALQEAARAQAIVRELSDVVGGVTDVVKFIQAIAAQTNLLALNATIEAARAGDAGKGFAVVASEVKTLANQTAKATDDIQAKVQAVQGAAAQAASIIGRIAHTVSAIVDGANSVAAAITEQGAATNEISRSIHEAAGKTHGISAAVADMTSSAEFTKSASGELHTSSSELARQAEGLREAIDTFLSAMHCAITGEAGPPPAEALPTAASAAR